jgi:hypothetical protein
VCECFSASARSTRLRVFHVPGWAHAQCPCACTLACRSGVTCRCGRFLSTSFPCALSDLYFRLPAPSPMLVPPFRAAQTFDTVFNTTVIKRSDEPSGVIIKVLVAYCCFLFSASIRSPPFPLPPPTQPPSIPRFRLWLSLFPSFFPLSRVLGHPDCVLDCRRPAAS